MRMETMTAWAAQLVGSSDVGSYVYRRHVEERGLWFGGYARHVALLYFMFLCDNVYGVKGDMALLEV